MHLLHILIALIIFSFLLVIDLVCFHNNSKSITYKHSLLMSAIWVVLAICFGGWVWNHYGKELGLQFYTGYIIEKTLSIDNLFVFSILFHEYKIPSQYQHKVLFWGIFGALVFRIIFILSGLKLLQLFSWVTYIFGAILVWAGAKAVAFKENEGASLHSLVKKLSCWMPVSHELDGNRFFTLRHSKKVATPLFLALLSIECADIVFAIDSVPAVLAISQDPFIVFTSNAFAILGLRSLYFTLHGMLQRFQTLHIGIGMILIFVGLKFFITPYYHIPTTISLAVILALFLFSFVVPYLSFLHRR